jgi:hypothetical protein
MQFNTAPANTLFAKVTVKTKPYSNEPVSIRIVADTYESFTANKAQFFTELPLQTTTMFCIESAVSKMQTLANAVTASTDIKPKVRKFIADVE